MTIHNIIITPPEINCIIPTSFILQYIDKNVITMVE